MLEKVILESKAIDLNSFSILVGKYVWRIEVEICLVNNDGNLLDACYLATIFSLLNFRLPLVKAKKGEKIEILGEGNKRV
jgi:exosome complex RNA-binding protein Rrp42 (RNase PH superfamily)